MCLYKSARRRFCRDYVCLMAPVKYPEIYLATFPGDQNIEQASISLIACILKAVEFAIAFFFSSTSKQLHIVDEGSAWHVTNNKTPYSH